MGNQRGGVISKLFLIPAGVVVIISVFALGYYIGRGQGKETASPEKLPALPDVVLQYLPKKEDFTFYKTLTEKGEKTWPAPSLRVRLRWSFGDGARDAEDEAGGEGEPVSAVPHAAQSGPQGPARLSWSGGGIAPGEVRESLKAGAPNDTEVVLRYDPRGGAGPDLAPEARGLPAHARNPTAVGWGGPWPAGSAPDADRLPYLRRETATGRQHTLGAVWRETEGLLAFSGGWVARPQAPPASGTWRPTFERGGQIAVVVSSDPRAKAVDRARRAKKPVHAVPSRRV